jgi:hypothetical protein
MSPNVKLLWPAPSEAKYCGSAGPGDKVTSGAALATQPRANQANPVVINKVLRMIGQWLALALNVDTLNISV